ncbi:MAG: hypothetical protein ACJ790_07120, partial [Myxococcaceae bacterium]
RLRLRAGTYLEPSPFLDHSLRQHFTGGLEWKMFHLVADWSLSLSFDYARQYFNYGLGIGFWR